MKHKIKSLWIAFFALALCLSILPSVSTEAAGNVYHVKNAKQLKTALKDMNATIYLDSSIHLLYQEWVPAGTDSKPFTGRFYGNGHTISGLRITKTKSNAGFFGVTSGAVITGLQVSGSIKNVSIYGGGIVGRATNNTRLKYCISNVSVVGKDQIGGVVGRVSDSTITLCMNKKNVSATGRGCGGITADLYPSGTLDRCVNLGNVSGGSDLTGGITGGSTEGKVTGCINTGNVKCKTGGRIGAIAGDNASYAGPRDSNYFLKTSKVNSKLPVVGKNCGTMKSKVNGKFIALKGAIIKGFRK